MLDQALMIAAFLVASSAPQRARLSTFYAYEPTQVPSPAMLSVQEKRPPNGTKPGVINGGHPAAKPGQSPSYVNISGNFGGVFYVSGIGGATSQTQTSQVSVITNRSLTLAATSFRPLTSAQNPNPEMGTISYTMAIYSGTPSQMGALVAGPVSGTDAGFNGQTLSITVPEQQANENFVLVITRTLYVNPSATGQCTLVGTGNISVAIN